MLLLVQAIMDGMEDGSATLGKRPSGGDPGATLEEQPRRVQRSKSIAIDPAVSQTFSRTIEPPTL